MENFLHYLFPRFCIVCGRHGEYLCKACQSRLKNQLPECYICRRLSKEFKTHQFCKSKGKIEQIYIVWEYNYIARQLMKQIKYKESLHTLRYLLEVLDKVLISDLSKDIFDRGILLPVSSSQFNYQVRGFSVSEEICKLLKKKFSSPIIKNLIYKNPFRQSQASSSLEKRIQNSQGSFTINEKVIKAQPERFKKIILVDDVITTGSTLNEIARLINQCQKEISILAFCLFRGKPHYSLTTIPTLSQTPQHGHGQYPSH